MKNTAVLAYSDYLYKSVVTRQQFDMIRLVQTSTRRDNCLHHLFCASINPRQRANVVKLTSLTTLNLERLVVK